MGMYDTVMVPCPVCGFKEEFQSKGGDCLLRVFELDQAPEDVLSDVNRHGPATCRSCNTVFSVILTTKAQVVADGPALGTKASVPAVLNFVKHLADQPCTKLRKGHHQDIGPAPVACRNTAKGDITWMCPACAAHHLVYVGNSQ